MNSEEWATKHHVLSELSISQTITNVSASVLPKQFRVWQHDRALLSVPRLFLRKFEDV